MKKAIPVLIMILLILIPDLSTADYLIRLKNGRQVRTPAYWSEGTEIFFYTAGGIVGMDRSEIFKVESTEAEDRLNTVVISKSKDEKTLPAASLPKEKLQEQPPPPQISKEQIDLKQYTGEKNRMMVELDSLMDELRAATSSKDKEAKEKIREKIREKSGQIYQLTDEVTKKNQGKLPEGWWGK